MPATSSAISFRTLAGMLSGPWDLAVFNSLRSFLTPSTEKLISGIYGNAEGPISGTGKP
jgi:hypothetical protein